MNGAPQKSIDVDIFGVRLNSVRYEKDVMEVLKVQVLMAGYEELFLCFSESESSNGDRVRHYPVKSNWFENIPRDTVKQVL